MVHRAGPGPVLAWADPRTGWPGNIEDALMLKIFAWARSCQAEAFPGFQWAATDVRCCAPMDVTASSDIVGLHAGEHDSVADSCHDRENCRQLTSRCGLKQTMKSTPGKNTTN